LSRIETREHGIRVAELEQLLDVYGVPAGSERSGLVELARKARDRGWEASFGAEINTVLRPVIGLEAGATAIRQFEAMIVPGLLQTADYMRAVIQAAATSTDTAADVERSVASRLARQNILRRARPPAYHVILDESVLLRTVAGRPVMRDQLRKLADLTAEPHMTIQVLALDSGTAPGVSGPFTIMSLPAATPDVLYGESAASGVVFADDPDRLRRATLRFGMLTERALSSEASVDLIIAAARGFEDELGQDDLMTTRTWRKSSFSSDNGGDCVELADLRGGEVGLRDSKHPEQGHLVFTRSEIAAWVAGAKAGEFDDLC
jgi:hypothetical protein